jgi:hypothetical protein
MFGCFAAAPPAQPSAPAPKRPKPDVAAPVPSAAAALPSSSPPNDSKPSAAPLSHIDGSACLAADSITTRLTQLCGCIPYAPLAAIMSRLTPRPAPPPLPSCQSLTRGRKLHTRSCAAPGLSPHRLEDRPRSVRTSAPISLPPYYCNLCSSVLTTLLPQIQRG